MEQSGFIGPSGANLGQHIGQQHPLAARAAVKTELVKDALEVVFDGGLRQVQRFGDLGVRPACGGELRDLQLPRAETADARTRGGRLRRSQQRAEQRRVLRERQGQAVRRGEAPGRAELPLRILPAAELELRAGELDMQIDIRQAGM